MKEHKLDFKIFKNNENIVYLDYAATTFMPYKVIDAWIEYNENIGVSINRSDGLLSKNANLIYRESKKRLLSFFNATEDYDIIFGKNATECLNILAYSVGNKLNKGDIVLLSPYEHHSNILPWKDISIKTGACLVELPLLESGEINYDFIYELDIEKIKVISVSLISNVTCSEFNKEKLKEFIKNTNSFTIIDVSQAVGHRELDFKEINADAYVMSAHKMYGPKNIGASITKKKEINKLKPVLLGGGMVWNSLGNNPHWHQGVRKFEAGTLDISLVKAWSEACNYIEEIGIENITNSDFEIWEYVKKVFFEKGIYILPGGNEKSSLCSFLIKNKHPHDISEIMSRNLIEIRTGHMCSQESLNNMGYTSVCRISWGIGSSKCDIDQFINVLEKLDIK